MPPRGWCRMHIFVAALRLPPCGTMHAQVSLYRLPSYRCHLFLSVPVPHLKVCGPSRCCDGDEGVEGRNLFPCGALGGCVQCRVATNTGQGGSTRRTGAAPATPAAVTWIRRGEPWHAWPISITHPHSHTPHSYINNITTQCWNP